MGRNIKDQKRNSGSGMTIVIIDYELENYVCVKFLDGRNSRKKFKEWLSAQNGDIYFVDVSDKTWEKFKTEKSKRVELDLDGLTGLIKKSSWLILIKNNYAMACIYYPPTYDKYIF